jgi:enoyl-CoA hydratase
MPHHPTPVRALVVHIHPGVRGLRKTKEFLFTGSNMTAAEALAAGMINRVVPGDRLEAESMALAERIALAEPFALRLLKRSLSRTQEAQGLRVALNAHFDTHQLSHVTEEFKAKVADGLSSRIAANKQVIGS